MPTYRVTDPTTGKTVKLTGDSPPTEQELEEVFAQVMGGGQQAAAMVPQEIPAPAPAPEQSLVDPMSAMSDSVNTPIDFSGIKQAAGRTMDYITQPISVPESTGQFLTENLPRSINRFPAAAAAGTGGMMYNAAKKFTDPVVNAWSGQQDLGSAVKDLFYAPRDAGVEFFNSLAHSTGAPLGAYGKEAAKEAWSDPAMASAAVAPLAIGAKRGMGAYADYIKPESTIEGLQNQLGNIVNKGFDKGIKPKGKMESRADVLKERRLQTEAITEIIESKEFLKFKDEFGETVTGKVPKGANALDELSQSIEQRKLATITQANEMNEAAGVAGAKVPVQNSINRLQEIIDDPMIQSHQPELYQYAIEKLEVLKKDGDLTPAQAQKVMAMFNQSKAVADANPSMALVARSQIDAIVANNLRSDLNLAVEGATGPGYSQLRKKFGALKSIEEPVNTRLKRYRQQNEKSALNLYDVFSYNDLFSGVGQVAAGSALGGFGNILKGIGLKGVAEQIKMGRDPNRAISKMFEKAEWIVPKLQSLISEREAASIVAEISGTNPLGQGPASPHEQLLQIAYTPEGNVALMEKFGRKAKDAKLAEIIQELQIIPQEAQYPLVPRNDVKIHYINNRNALGQ